MWFLGITVSGLLFVTLQPFGSDEACHLAAKTVGLEQGDFECIEIPIPKVDE